jgi:hypothetical protein
MNIKEKYSDFLILIKYGGFTVELLHEMSEQEINQIAKQIKKRLNN